MRGAAAAVTVEMVPSAERLAPSTLLVASAGLIDDDDGAAPSAIVTTAGAIVAADATDVGTETGVSAPDGIVGTAAGDDASCCGRVARLAASVLGAVGAALIGVALPAAVSVRRAASVVRPEVFDPEAAALSCRLLGCERPRGPRVGVAVSSRAAIAVLPAMLAGGSRRTVYSRCSESLHWARTESCMTGSLTGARVVISSRSPDAARSRLTLAVTGAGSPSPDEAGGRMRKHSLPISSSRRFTMGMERRNGCPSADWSFISPRLKAWPAEEAIAGLPRRGRPALDRPTTSSTCSPWPPRISIDRGPHGGGVGRRRSAVRLAGLVRRPRTLPRPGRPARRRLPPADPPPRLRRDPLRGSPVPTSPHRDAALRLLVARTERIEEVGPLIDALGGTPGRNPGSPLDPRRRIVLLRRRFAVDFSWDTPPGAVGGPPNPRRDPMILPRVGPVGAGRIATGREGVPCHQDR